MAGNALGIKEGGTSQTTAPGARIALGLEIGVDIQEWDADLDAISALSTTGMLARTSAGTYSTRTITGTANRITMTNGDGVAGNPTIDISATYVGQTSITTLGTIVTGVWNGTDIAVADGGTGVSTITGLLSGNGTSALVGRTIAVPTGMTIANANGASGNPTISLADDLAAIEALNTNGILTRTASNTWAARTITGTANKVDVTNGNGVSGNPTLTIPDAVTLVTPTVTGTLTAQALLDISGASAGQISFPAAQNASAGANVLDDYEEGTWTPQMTFNGSSTGVTYTTQTGRYTKIGRLVYLEGEVLLSSNGSGVGSALITNLPFTPGVVGGTGVVMISGGSTLTAGATGILSAGSATISIRQHNTAGSAQSSDTNVTDTARFFINATFSI